MDIVLQIILSRATSVGLKGAERSPDGTGESP